MRVNYLAAVLLIAGTVNPVPGQEPPLDLPVVRYVAATQTSPESWVFKVTVEHNDEGWDHYADAWQVVHPDTLEVLGERILLHPHDHEQPFTREGVVELPQSLTAVLVHARCTVHGSGEPLFVDFTGESDLYEVAKAGAPD